MLRDAAKQKIREYIKYARQEGLTWIQIGEALNLHPVAEESGAGIADLAFDHAAGAEHARPFETLTFAWRGRAWSRGIGCGLISACTFMLGTEGGTTAPSGQCAHNVLGFALP